MLVHKELLNHADWRARKEGLNCAYRIKKKYDRDLNIKHQLARRSLEDVEDEIADTLGEALEMIAQE